MSVFFFHWLPVYHAVIVIKLPRVKNYPGLKITQGKKLHGVNKSFTKFKMAYDTDEESSTALYLDWVTSLDQAL